MNAQCNKLLKQKMKANGFESYLSEDEWDKRDCSLDKDFCPGMGIIIRNLLSFMLNMHQNSTNIGISIWDKEQRNIVLIRNKSHIISKCTSNPTLVLRINKQTR